MKSKGPVLLDAVDVLEVLLVTVTWNAWLPWACSKGGCAAIGVDCIADNSVKSIATEIVNAIIVGPVFVKNYHSVS